jgi:hypothetical protein
MGWCTTYDLDTFAAAADGYLRSRAAENTLLLSAVQAIRSGWLALVDGQRPGPVTGAGPGAGLLFGWWEPPDGSDPRGAFLHDPAVPLLISGRAPEMAAALAATLSKMGRLVRGVDAPIEVADAFAAAWSQRAGLSVRVHRHCRVYRLAGAGAAPGADAWPPPEAPGPVGRLRVATPADHALLAEWLAAFAAEAAERTGSPHDLAADLISYGGAIFWEVPQKSSRRLGPAHYLASPRHRDVAQFGEPAHQPVALATLTRPVAGTVRISTVYTPPERRHNGYAAAVTHAVSRAVLAGAAPGAASARGCVNEVVMITDRNRPDRWGARPGYQLIGERAVLRFGPATGPLPRLPATGPMPRLPTGPLPRLRR